MAVRRPLNDKQPKIISRARMPRKHAGKVARRPLNRNVVQPLGKATSGKNILFVCIGGTGISAVGRDYFKTVAGTKNQNTYLELEITGTQNPLFRKKLAKADIVVPMFTGLAPEIKKAMKEMKLESRLVDPKFRNSTDVGNKKNYEKLFDLIFEKEK